MRAMILSLAGSLLLVTGGCDRMGGGGTEQGAKVEALEKQVTSLQRRDRDMRLKAQISHNLGGCLSASWCQTSFWEETYDVGEVECAKRCIGNLTTHNQACAAITDRVRRTNCYAEALEGAKQCHKGCDARFQPVVP